MMSPEELLKEREKELACIQAICLLAAGAPEPLEAAEGIARALCQAMRFPEQVSCRVSFWPRPDEAAGEARGEAAGDARGEAAGEARGEAAAVETVFGRPPEPLTEAPPRLEARLPAEDSLGWRGLVSLEYREPGLAFLPQEEALLGTVLVVAASMLRTADLISRLRASGQSLLSKNLALREVLSAIEAEKREMSLSFRERLTAEILPLAERARDSSLSPERRDSYLELLVEELRRGGAELGPASLVDPALSPREREVAIQVRNGRTSKEIGELLGISPATVERHRHNIRRKLRVRERGLNLAGLLANRDASEHNL